MLKTELFIEKAKKIHGDKYDYSKVEYVNNRTKVCVICPKHGEFFITPHNHLKGRGCQICGAEDKRKKLSDTTESFIEKAKKVHGDKYDYSKVEYTNNSTKVCIICPQHGEFWQMPSGHLNKNRPRGCPQCGIINTNIKNTYTTREFIEKARNVHGDKYDYSKVEYVKSNEKICIICPQHGEFLQTPASHLNGCGCPFCGGNIKDTTETFIEKAKNVHGDEYDYSKVEYVNSQTPIKIICQKHGEFWQSPNNHISKKYGCPKCHAITSKKEDELYEFVSSLIGEDKVLRNCRNVIPPLELDIYIPSLSIAIEFDGLRWHSEEFESSPTYHLDKTNLCNEKGIRLIHIFEDEWDMKQDVVKSILKSCFGMVDSIYARKCNVREISSSEARDFINANHIQNYVPSNVNIGLFNDDKIVSVMTFGNLRRNLGQKSKEGYYEMLRYSTSLNLSVIGGASKLFSYFKKKYKPKYIKTYSDIRLFSGKVYQNLGFSFVHLSQPNYFYVIDGHRENRFKYRKDKLVSEGYDRNKTEHEIMLNRGIFRIYDCGCNVYEWKNER